MFYYTPTQPDTAPKSASEVVVRMRELSRHHERLNAAYQKDVKSKTRRPNVLKALLSSFVGLF